MKIEGNKAVLADLAAIAFVWCGCAFIVNPVGEFAIIDDWVYKTAVEHLLKTGQYPTTEAAPLGLVSNVLWGSLFSVPAGASFLALRISTLVATLIGLFGLYGLVMILGRPRWVSVLVTMSVGASATYYALSYTFMTTYCLSPW